MKGLEITLLWQDPNIEEFYFRISNEMNSCELTLYILVQSLYDFGKKLQEFPQSINDKISFEINSTDSCYLLLEALCYNQFGHAALKVHAINNSIMPHIFDLTFYIQCEVAAINELGSLLANWDLDNNYYLEWHPKM
ncbi:hypothetical protein [Runella zeae]|uniref:hypothetical protein n=1 Tax=Runella zeae TaxID=94255 RepID=UPI002355BB0B|nr:hypothetical protein [Runella zeae]